jgi:uroporphyrinogen decarboxylase
MEDFLVDVVAEPEFAHEVLDRLCELETGLWDVFLDEVGDYIQMVEWGDDFGIQNGLMLSADTYRSVVKPYQRRVNDAIHKRTKAKLFHHTCGSIYSLVEEMIDVGVDVLNPVQPLAAHNDSFRLKREFGDRICFHGGVDEQMALPTGTEQDVENEVRTRIEAFAPGGGYILAAAHNIQPDTPPQNVVAMFRAAKKYGKYPIQER